MTRAEYWAVNALINKLYLAAVSAKFDVEMVALSTVQPNKAQLLLDVIGQSNDEITKSLDIVESKLNEILKAKGDIAAIKQIEISLT